MKTKRLDSIWLCLLTAAAIIIPQLSLAQLIAIKTVPIATTGQSLIYPSRNLGMGGTTLAVDDPFLDPFSNPAKGSRLSGAMIFSSPAFGKMLDYKGGVRSLPVGALVGSDTWFAGAHFTAQEVAPLQEDTRDFFVPLVSSDNSSSSLSDYSTNTYAFGLIGRELPRLGIAIAASASYAELDGMEGLGFLYGRNSRIDQSGQSMDYRIGVLRETSDRRSFEMVLLHNRVSMTHEVYSSLPIFFDEIGTVTSTSAVRNLDKTNTSGLHLASKLPLGAGDSRAGFIFTANRKSHPKIPNYVLMNIPRDPGDSWAFNFGAGISRSNEYGILAMDVIFEPIWSHTWADAADTVRTSRGELIPAGGMTVENYFQFRNWVMRVGLSQFDKNFNFQLGLEARFYRYRLKQTDFVRDSRRSQKELWSEWTPTIGFGLAYPGFEIRYAGHFTLGTGEPGVERGFATAEDAASSRSSDLLIAPSGRLTVREALVITQQISVVVSLSSR